MLVDREEMLQINLDLIRIGSKGVFDSEGYRNVTPEEQDAL